MPASTIRSSITGLPGLIGQSDAFLQAVALIQRIARCDAPVLIQGESGTGKELAARATHYQSARRDAPFVPLNCGAVPEALIETELFGCERGAFTDARQSRIGLAAAAHGGTLFLDEVDALSARAQVALLRFLQEHVYRPVGGTREQSSDVRVIAAASPRLGGLLRTGAFRDDLIFRLNVLPLEMPPLRRRPGDAALLADHFIARHARQHDRPPRGLDAISRAWVASYSWPGNVRELDNLVQRASFLTDGAELCLIGMVDGGGMTAADSGASGDTAHCGARPLTFNEARAAAMSRFEQQYLEQVMSASGGNVTHAARLAGKERRALGKLLKRHSIDRVRFGLLPVQ